MNVNYNINHKLLQFPVFTEKMTTTEHQALLITFSFIVHWCTVSGGTCEFKQNAMSKDWRIKPHYFKKSRDLLVKSKYITEIKSYSRGGDGTTGHGYFYKLGPAYASLAKKLYLVGEKPVPPRGKVNNIKLFQREDAVNTSPPLKKESIPPLVLTKNNEDLDYYKEQLKRKND